jgi:hypothetical protein
VFACLTFVEMACAVSGLLKMILQFMLPSWDESKTLPSLDENTLKMKMTFVDERNTLSFVDESSIKVWIVFWILLIPEHQLACKNPKSMTHRSCSGVPACQSLNKDSKRKLAMVLLHAAPQQEEVSFLAATTQSRICC